MNAEDVVVNLLKLNGGEVVGRTRLQKEAYLLDRCGAHFGLPFTYHYYGPYSFALADGWADARYEKRIDIEEHTGRYGVPYSIFKLRESDHIPDDFEGLSANKARLHLQRMRNVSDVVLELAATFVYLKEQEGRGERAVEELKLRKPLKATDGRIEKAFTLLRDLDLLQ